MVRTRKAKKDPEVIAFRFRDREHRAEFLQRAKALGISPHELARTYVTGVLEAAEEKADLHEQLEHLHREMLATRNDLALATEAILEFGGETEKTVAQEWVKKRLNRPLPELPEP